jgi:hypothetical protein
MYVYTSTALGRVLTSYVALLWVEVGQPCSKQTSKKFKAIFSYKIKDDVKRRCGIVNNTTSSFGMYFRLLRV